MRRSSKIACALVSGVLLWLSFPTVLFGWHMPDMGWLAWIALVPLVIAMRGASPSRAFLFAFICGLVAYAGSLYWLYNAMHAYGKMSPQLSVLVLILLVVLQSLYMGMAAFTARFIQVRFRGEFLAWLPVCWVAFEFARNYTPMNGFSWANIAMSQWKNLYAIQVVDVVGVYGLIFLIVWVNVFIAEMVVRLRGESVRLFLPKAIATAVLVAAMFIYGYVRYGEMLTPQENSPVLKVGIVQPNIPQDEKWAPQKLARNLHRLRHASRRLRDAGIDLIIWPEASFPFELSTEALEIDPRALGFDQGEIGEYPLVMMGAITEKPDGDYYNSAVVFDAQGKKRGQYHKAHLVPFGEYVPYEKLFFFARKLAEPIGKFQAGESFDPIVTGQGRIGPLICYEDVFPEIARKLTANGAQVLVNLTNDAWYGVSSAPFQHVALSVFRAVENRRSVVRSTNTGVSAIIAPSGKLVMESDIFEDALMVGPVVLDDRLTLYTRLGDWFAWACVAYAAVGLILGLILKYRRVPQ